MPKENRPLHVGRGVTWPAAIASQATALLGVRGAGKSNLGRVVAEECFRSGIPFVVFDPVGNWYGIRSGRDGKPKGGTPIPIFGGEHKDLPLDRTSGTKIADLVIDKKLSCVLDMSHEDFSEADKTRFLADFGDRLFRRKKRDTGWLLLILEEADDYAPQPRSGGGVRGPALATLGVFQKLVRRGRFKGLGALLITQRSAAINKDLLYMVGNLIVFRTTGPGDMKAIEGWVKAQSLSTEMMASLPQLEDGEAWVWSPEFLKDLSRVKFRYMDTYDTGATPEHGSAEIPPATLADIDVPVLTKELQAAVERAKAEDPRELQAKLAELRQAYQPLAADLAPGASPKEVFAALHRLKAQAAKHATAPPAREVPAMKDAQIKRLEGNSTRMIEASDRYCKAMDLLWKNQVEVHEALLGALRQVANARTPPATVQREPMRFRGADRPRADLPHFSPPRSTPPKYMASGDETMPAMRRAFLAALAQHDQLSKRQILVYTGYASSGSVSAEFARMVREGEATIPAPHHLQITDHGRSVLGAYDPLPAGDDLRAYLLDQKRNVLESALLKAIFEAYPKPISKSEILQVTGYASSGSVSAAFAKIALMGWAKKAGPHQLRAADELFQNA